MMNKPLLIRTTAAMGSLTGYYIAQNAKVKSWYPFIVIGGMLGALAGEILTSDQPDNEQ